MKMEDHITDGPLYEEPTEQPEPSPEFERNTSLVDALRDIAGLSAQTDRLDNLYTGLSEGMYRKPQA